MTMEQLDEMIEIAQKARAECIHSPKGNICPGCIVTAMQRARTIERNRVLGDPAIEKVHNWIYSYQIRHLRKAIKYAETGIEQAIMDEDGMDGLEGEQLLKLIRTMASIKEAEAELALKSLLARAEELCGVALDPLVPEASKKTAVEALKRALALAPTESL